MPGPGVVTRLSPPANVRHPAGVRPNNHPHGRIGRSSCAKNGWVVVNGLEGL
jgi:hypothetical protein